jgi:competence CoiA-like predicted nuclease
MLYANSINGEKILATKNNRAICPFCDHVVIAKCGEINIHHWSHRSNSDCDTWYEPESDWHLKWKSKFPRECVEVKFKHDGKFHRADILNPDIGGGNFVIELQHSPISTRTIRERELFYGDMIWIIDMSTSRNRFIKREISDRDFVGYSTHEFDFIVDFNRPTLSYFKRPLLFDFGTTFMLLVLELRFKFGKGLWVDRGFVEAGFGRHLIDVFKDKQRR